MHQVILLSIIVMKGFFKLRAKSRAEVTRTYYDEPNFQINWEGQTIKQENLRTRVSSVTYQESPGTTYDQASHYSYDVHGNVKTLIQEIGNKTLVKRLDYEYDLISGKVNFVYYQPNKTDQFTHKYEYDSDNRITKVFTSKDGVLWDNDAKYQYYAHGPVARTVIGENEVETQNFAYTLQGWIKGLNGQHFKYALGYNATDYAPILNTQNSTFNTPVVTGKELFNGNIATWTSKNKQLSATDWTQQFEYDQLNRIKSGTTLGGTNNYKNTYSYDPNGNITSLKRYDATGDLFDDLAYNYQNTDKGYKENTNKLRSVDDNSTDNPLRKDDLKDMDIDNYQYDEVGNLVFDESEKIKSIEWTLFGKIKSVTREVGSGKYDLVFAYDALGDRVSKSATLAGVTNTTYYIKDALGNSLATYSTLDNSITPKIDEFDIHNTTHIGTYRPIVSANGNAEVFGNKSYEIKDHLGSVRAIVSDMKNSPVLTAYDYYPFGMIANKTESPSSSYGYSGKRKESELNENDYDFDSRLYDGRLAKWFSIDNKFSKYPSSTPYNYVLNSPISLIDPDGEDPTNYEASLMAKSVYANPENPLTSEELSDLQQSGWKVSSHEIKSQIVGSFKNGFKAELYEKTNEDGTTEYAYVMAGTDMSGFGGHASWLDWKNNLIQPFGISSQYTQAKNNAHAADKAFKENVLTFVGHSLAGGLAALSSYVTGRNAITFNSATVGHFSRLRYGVRMGHGGTVTNHMIIGDPVSGLLNPEGNNIYYAPKPGLSMLDKHDMNNFPSMLKTLEKGETKTTPKSTPKTTPRKVNKIIAPTLRSEHTIYK